MASEDVTIKRHTGNVADLENEMCGLDDSAHSVSGEKHFHYKDNDGRTHQCANMDEGARFHDLTVTDTITIPDNAIAHDKTGDKNSNPRFMHIDETPTSGGKGFLVSASGFIPGSTDKVEVKPENLRLLKEGASTSDSLMHTAICDSYMWMVFGTTVLARINKHTLTDRVDYSVPVGAGPLVCPDNDRLFSLIDSFDIIRVFSQSKPSAYYDIAHDFTDTDINDAVYRNGKLWFFDNGQLVGLNDDSTLSPYYAETVSITQRCKSIEVDATETYAYLMDFPASGAGDGYVRKVQMSDGSIISSSVSIPTISEFGKNRLIDGFLYVITRPATGTITCIIVRVSDMVVVHSSSLASNLVWFNFYKGFLYGRGSNTGKYTSIALPSVPHKIKGSVELDIHSSRIKHEGLNGDFNFSDLLKSSLISVASFDNLAGTAVESVSAALPTTADDKLYLINGGSTVHEGHVIWNSAVLGIQRLPRSTGSSVRTGKRKYYFDGTSWNGEIEHYTGGQFTIPQGTDAGSHDIVITDLLNNIGSNPQESADLSARLSLQVAGDSKQISSEHEFWLNYDTSNTANWIDTLFPDTDNDFPWLVSIALQHTSTQGAARFVVTWDTTSRAVDIDVTWSMRIKGHVFNVGLPYS